MNYYEKLSEYIDGELTPTEVEELETRLAVDEVLRKKLNELRQLKQAVIKSISPLPESPYFETRLFAELKRPVSLWNKLKKYSPITAIAVVTIALMVVLKYNPQLLQNIVEEQKTNIAGFYKQNLQPLLYASNLSNEDIFNFAFYHQLPLNKTDNQYLHLGYDKSGDEFFEIKNASVLPGKNNLESFIRTLNLNSSQKQKVDSILESYADDIQTQILVNDKNTVAINPNIWNFNKALVADLLSFAEAANKKQFVKIVPEGANFAENVNVMNIVKQVKEKKPNQYIFITPDTIFSDEYQFDKTMFVNEMKKMKQEVKNTGKELRRIAINIQLDSNIVKFRHFPPDSRNFHVNVVDANVARVNIPENFVPEINLPDFKIINKQIEEAAKNFQEFSFEVPDPKSLKHQFNFKFRGDNGEPVDIKINLDSLFDPNAMINTPKSSKKNKTNFNMKFNLDSLMSSMKSNGLDSMNSIQREEFNYQMKELQKEMKKFREEIKNMQKEFRQEKKIKKDSDTIEI